MDRQIGHTKEGNNIWVYQFFPLENRLDDGGLLDRSMRKAGTVITTLTKYPHEKPPVRSEEGLELLGINLRAIQRPFVDGFVRPDIS